MNEQYKELFVSESLEILQKFSQDLVNLEKDKTNKNLINSLFRGVHTIKGMAASMGYTPISELSHKMESVLDSWRQDQLENHEEAIEFLFSGADLLQGFIEAVSKNEPLSKMNIEKKTQKRETNSIRVPLSQLDKLMNLVGELVINKIRLSEILYKLENKDATHAADDLGRLTNDLQAEMMQTRLVPLEYIVSSYPRMVRDLSKNAGKNTNLKMKGVHIGLDRTVLDEINDPLIHLLRNAVDHGIEDPLERKRQGKKEEGSIELSARRERNFVLIEMSDDGCGLDPQKIRNVVLEKRIMKQEELQKLSDNEVLNLITHPSFTTAEKVTEVSGRGVGMNVVKSKVEALGGSLSISSRLHKGTTFRLKLPLSLATVQSLLVRIGGGIYTLPLANVIETIKVNSSKIKQIENHPIISYRRDVLSLINLKERFNDKERSADQNNNEEFLSIVVAESGTRRAGFIVDDFLGEQEVVIKSFQGLLRGISGIAGTTILGSGRVAMILDVGAYL